MSGRQTGLLAQDHITRAELWAGGGLFVQAFCYGFIGVGRGGPGVEDRTYDWVNTNMYISN